MTSPIMSDRTPQTILFFPCSHGVGFGYIGRALHIAEELRTAGHTCVFASDSVEKIIARCGFAVCAPDSDHGISVPDMPARQGEYIPIGDLNTVFGMMRYYHPGRIRAHLSHDLQVIDAVRPSVVVIDMHPTAGIAARHRGIPVVSVADSDFLRDDPNSWMPWLAPGTVKMPYPSCVPAFNEVLTELALEPIRHVSDLLWGTLTLLASVQALESALPPLHERGPHTYVGPIHWDPPWSNVNETLQHFGDDADKRIYVTLGHGGKVLRHQVEAVLNGCDRPEWAVFASLGLRTTGGEVRLPANARAGEFTGISRPIEWSDVVISHGGHATVLASLQYGRPSIVIPFMSEQEANGRLWVEGQGAGFVLRKAVPTRAPGQHFDFLFRYSGHSDGVELRADDVRLGLEEIFANRDYAERASLIGSELRSAVERRSFLRLFTQTTRSQPCVSSSPAAAAI